LEFTSLWCLSRDAPSPVFDPASTPRPGRPMTEPRGVDCAVKEARGISRASLPHGRPQILHVLIGVNKPNIRVRYKIRAVFY